MFGRILSRSFTLVLVLFAVSMAAFAQDLDDVTISGKVLDSNGLAIVGANITATEINTGVDRSGVTDSDGQYRLIKLKPGTYKFKAAASGFGSQETSEIVTISAQNLLQNFKLLPADVRAEQTVTVSSDDGPVVDTSRTIVGGTIAEREIEEIPNDTRNPLDLVLTLGGTAEEQLSTRDLADDRGGRGITAPGTTPEEAGIFGLSGGAAYSNNITIDGMDNNDDRSASFRFQPSIEGISEVQVITNQFSAEYGRASGGRVNIRTRAGGNKFRGRAFYFFRDDQFNANTWNNNRRGIAKPAFTNHNPGVTFGGPVVKNKLFFFTAYEFDNIQEDTIVDAWVPVSAGNPNFSLPAPTNPAGAVNVTSTFNGVPVTVAVAPYIEPFPTPAKKHIFTARADWNINDSQNITFSYQMGRSDDLRNFSGTNRIGNSLIGRIRNTDGYNFTHNWVITPQVVNQFRFQYSTLRPRSEQAAGANAPAVLVTFVPPGESSTTQVFGSTTNSSDRIEDRWQFQDSLSYVHGKSTLRMGFDAQKVDTTFVDRFDATGTYRFSSFAFFSVNSVTSMTQNFNTNSAVKNEYIGAFMQNDWRVFNNLTINYGIRYEREKVVKDTNNFGPRVGLAWNPFPKGEKTVIRLGAGLFYNRVLLRTIDDFTGGSQELSFNSASLNVPTGTSVDVTALRAFLSTQFPNPLTLDTIIPVNPTLNMSVRALSRAPGAFRRISADLKVPESYQFNAGFEREIHKGLVFEVNVTYNKTVRLWREFNPNAPLLPAGTPDRNGDGKSTFTDYLLGITTGPNRFYSGSISDTVGTHTSQDDNAPACAAGTGTPICYINVNTPNSNSSTSCSTTTTITNTPVCRAFSVLNNLRPLFGEVGQNQLEQVASIGNSQYIGAVFELRTRYKKWGHGFGGSLRAVYTLSKLMDDGIVNTSEATYPGDFSSEWSRSLADRRHRVAITATVDTPKWMGKLRLSPIFRWGSSAPFNVSAGGIDRSLDDISNDRPNFNGDPKDINWRVYGTQPFPAGLAGQFTYAPIGSPGNLPRNAGNGPASYSFNLNVTREFKFKERFRIRPTAEFTNLLNMNVFSFGSNFINFENLSSSNPVTLAGAQAGFLAPTRTGVHRRMRFGIRFDF